MSISLLYFILTPCDLWLTDIYPFQMYTDVGDRGGGGVTGGEGLGVLHKHEPG